ncbi:MAG TPA: HAMP domain-containing sensor histidine kinase, partial [Thermoleophilaceae bacterium]|nr:HAMP domain-containing sensor histidine kinase [Thermoleophilaceae bacterium]
PEPFGGPEGYVQLVLPDGRAVGRPGTEGQLPVDERAREIASEGSGSYLADKTVDGVHLRVLTEALPRAGALQVARPLDEIDRQLDRVLLLLVFVGAGGVALGAGLGALVARTALAPIDRFTRRTEQLAADPDPSERMEVGGGEELARLARSFNATLDSLERSVEAQRQLVADASHELRTPIASLRANIQTLGEADRLPSVEREALRADVVGELDELTALVADVVELARGAAPGELTDEVSLDQIVEAVAERARTRTDGRAEFRVRTEPTVVRGDPGRIHRAVSNLVDNAVKWSPPGEPVELALSGGALTVRDHGPGFDDADLPRVFERFYRADGARGLPGSGLGLAIVRQAAEAHGGSAEAANAAGGGALLRVSFGPVLSGSSQLRVHH